MRRGARGAWLIVAMVSGLAGCAPSGPELGVSASNLNAAQRRVRLGQIRDAARRDGITQGWLLGGIADAETYLAHCYSELTFSACQGPSSPDCGNGPVTAGGGDGPCSLRQGGLGMFQFDAGDFDDTLAREGDRILSIAGNVDAAVDFTVTMVKNSTYVANVSTDAEAIAWMNGVRIDNDRWNPWIQTVVRYYNGCSPTASCWSGRIARYRDHTVSVFNEVGASFWDETSSGGTDAGMSVAVDAFVPVTPDTDAAVPVMPGHGLAAQLEGNTFGTATIRLAPGAFRAGTFLVRNVGTEVWGAGEVFLETTNPRSGMSQLYSPDWTDTARPIAITAPVYPGNTVPLSFTIQAPMGAGVYRQSFNLLHADGTFFSDDGGPTDDLMFVDVSVEGTSTGETCGSVGSAWQCTPVPPGDTPRERLRCISNRLVREQCGYACVAEGSQGLCDGDGDGATLRDCDDGNPDIHPDAAEICGNAADENCNGIADEDCDGVTPIMPTYPDAGRDTEVRRPRAGGCSVTLGTTDRPSSSRRAAGSTLVGVALALLLARRRAR